MKKFLLILSIFVSSLAIFNSCTKSTIAGSELFSKDKLDFTFTDTISLTSVTDKIDSLLTYTYKSPYSSLLLGNYIDPTFGQHDAQIYTTMFAAQTVDFRQLKDSTIIDSMVLYLAYNPTYFYGDTTQTQTVSVYRVTEKLPNTTNSFSNVGYSTETNPLGTVSFLPTPQTKDTKHPVDSTLTKAYLRIPISSITLKNTLLDTIAYSKYDPLSKDSVVVNNIFINRYTNSLDLAFTKAMKGIKIQATTQTNCVLSIDLSSSTFYVYYHKPASPTVKNFHAFPFASSESVGNTFRKNYFSNNYNGAPIAPFIGNIAKGKDRLFVESMSGVNTKIEIPFANIFGKVDSTGKINTAAKIAINKAEIEFVVDDIDGSKFPEHPQIFIYKLDRNGNFTPIEDVISQSVGDYSSFGGSSKSENFSGTSKKVYRMSMSNHFQKMVDGREGTVFYIVPQAKDVRGGRTIFYGTNPTDPTKKIYRARLNVTYTRL
jgi:hypothetical protein